METNKNSNKNNINMLNNAFISVAGSCLCGFSAVIMAFNSLLKMQFPAWVIVTALLMTIGFVLAIFQLSLNFILEKNKIKREGSNYQSNSNTNSNRHNFLSTFFVILIGSMMFIFGIAIIFAHPYLKLEYPTWVIISSVLMIIGFVLAIMEVTFNFINSNLLLKSKISKNIETEERVVEKVEINNTNNKDSLEELKKQVWNKARIVQGQDPKLYRLDYAGALMFFASFVKNPDKKTETNPKSYNWTIAFHQPLSLGGTQELDNMQPVNTINSLNKENKTDWTTKISFNGKENVIKEQKWKL